MNALSKSGQCHSSLKLTSRTFLQRLNCLGSANSVRSVQMFLKEKEKEGEKGEGGGYEIYLEYMGIHTTLISHSVTGRRDNTVTIVHPSSSSSSSSSSLASYFSSPSLFPPTPSSFFSCVNPRTISVPKVGLLLLECLYSTQTEPLLSFNNVSLQSAQTCETSYSTVWHSRNWQNSTLLHILVKLFCVQ